MYPESVKKTIDIVSRWEGIDFLVKFIVIGQWARPGGLDGSPPRIMGGLLEKNEAVSKPVAIVLEPSILPEEGKGVFNCIQRCVSSRLPVYYSFASAANAISLVLSYNENRPGKLGT